MSLITCADCSKEYSNTAAACPNCGARIKKPKLWLWIPLGLIGSFLAWAAIRTPSPEETEKNQARMAVSICWDEQKKKSNNAGTAQFIAGACEKMERDFTAKYGRSP